VKTAATNTNRKRNHRQISQDIPLVNPTDAGLSAQATLVTTSAPGSGSGGGDKLPQVFSGACYKVSVSSWFHRAVKPTSQPLNLSTSNRQPPGPRDVGVPVGGAAPYPLTFRPLAAGTYAGRLELFIAATGERWAQLITYGVSVCLQIGGKGVTWTVA
jgi:hypothetical protein